MVGEYGRCSERKTNFDATLYFLPYHNIFGFLLSERICRFGLQNFVWEEKKMVVYFMTGHTICRHSASIWLKVAFLNAFAICLLLCDNDDVEEDWLID